ncbi:alkaline phosphatase D family protein, partial [Nocardiopsis lucentensis]|uniref:alkaline phosphatase D family protein n=1 Tax=Nocardiopsis lucentensis TaxID=53441 RepID=UPI0004760010
MSVVWTWHGAVTPTTVWVRARVDPGDSSAELRVDTDPEITAPVTFGPVAVDGVDMASIEATGLEPSTRYYYQWVIDGTPQLTIGRGQFLTAPPQDGTPQSFIIGAAGDAGLIGTGDDSFITDEVSDNPVFGTMLNRALAEDWVQFIHLGDMHYRDIATNTPADYRDAYDDVLTFNGLGVNAEQNRFFRNVSMAYVWDDHDFGPNNSDGTFVGRPAAAQVYRETVPHYDLTVAGASSTDAPIFQSWQLGRVQFIALDSRWARDPNTDLDTDRTKTMLGAAQKLQLEQVLRNTTAQALVLISPSIWLSDQAGGDESVDSWGRFRVEREELVQILGDHGWLERMVMLNADKHALSMSSGPANPWGGFPMFMFASLDASFSTSPELQYDIGQSPGRQRYGTLQVVDSGHTIALHGTGYVNDTVWRTYTGYAFVEPHVVALDYSAGQLFDPFRPVDDDQQLANDVTAQRRDGGDTRIEDTDGPVGVDAVGRYTDSATVNIESNDTLADQAGWLLPQGTVDEARYPTIGQHLTNPRMEDLRRDVARLDAGDAVTIDNPPPWLPPERISAVAEGYQERITTHDWQIEYNASPASLWQVGVTAFPTSMLYNRDFEAGTYGWFGFQSTLSHDLEVSFRGQGSARQTPNGVDNLARTVTTLVDSPRVYAGTEYFFSVWVMTANGRDVDVSVLWRDTDGNQISFPFVVSATFVTAGVWTQLSGSVIAPEGAFRMQLNINQRQSAALPASDELWIDEVLMTDGSDPGTNQTNRAATRGSELVTAIDSTETELVVHTDVEEGASARWVNSSGPGVTFAHEFPFDVRGGGETMRVLSCEPAAWDLFRRADETGTWGTSSAGVDWIDTAVSDTNIGTSSAFQYGFLQLLANTSTIRQQTLDLGYEVGDCEILWSIRTNQISAGASQL